MKNSFFEMLLNLFEETLTELKKNSISLNEPGNDEAIDDNVESELLHSAEELKAEVIQSAHLSSMRVFTEHEKMKLTKASYQFLMRLLVWEVIHPDTLETVINQLVFSESRIVTLEETKWTVRNVLADVLGEEQLSFLDLVLYQKEDGYTLH